MAKKGKAIELSISYWIKAAAKFKFHGMQISKQVVAERIAAYLHHRISLSGLVEWCETALLDGDFEERDAALLSEVIARIGVSDVRAFGLSWEDCEELPHKLGFVPRVEVVAA